MATKVWTGKEVEKVLMIAQDVLSLNTLVTNETGEETELGELVEDITSPSPEELILKQGAREKLVEYMNKYLTEQQRDVLLRRYGFICETPMTLQEIADEYGLCRERVRQIEQKALRRLRGKFLLGTIDKEDI